MAYSSNTILFEALKNILTEKSEKMFLAHIENEEQWKTFSKFMVMRYLTMSANPEVRDIVLENYLQLDRMPPKALYHWLMAKIPKQYNSFIRYIK